MGVSVFQHRQSPIVSEDDMTPRSQFSPDRSVKCKRGHILVGAAACVECVRYRHERYLENRELRIYQAAEWRKANYDHWWGKEKERIAKDATRIKALNLENRKKNRERAIWASMIFRCSDPRHKSFHRYGGRGIKVCDRWMNFDNFYTDMGPRPSARHSVERRDNDQGYNPGNCYWATPDQQSRNTSRNRIFTLNGKTQCMSDWAKDLGVTVSLLWTRISYLKWPLERALTTGPYRRTMAEVAVEK